MHFFSIPIMPDVSHTWVAIQFLPPSLPPERQNISFHVSARIKVICVKINNRYFWNSNEVLSASLKLNKKLIACWLEQKTWVVNKGEGNVPLPNRKFIRQARTVRGQGIKTFSFALIASKGYVLLCGILIERFNNRRAENWRCLIIDRETSPPPGLYHSKSNHNSCDASKRQAPFWFKIVVLCRRAFWCLLYPRHKHRSF